MAVYDTEENGRSITTRQTLYGKQALSPDYSAGRGLIDTVDWSNNRIIFVDNNSCEETKRMLKDFCERIEGFYQSNSFVIPLPSNIGTAKAVNKALAFRKKDEFAIKMDNDAVIRNYNWIEDMEDVIRRMPQIGVLGLKRPDLQESVYAINTDQRTRLLEVPHETGQRWRVVEDAKMIMGTCTMLNPALLERVGGFYQMDGLYGFDDCLMCVRSTVAGFTNCFLHGIDIDHIDPGGTEYTDWKAKHAGEILSKYGEVEAAYKSGVRDVYEPIQ